MHISRYALFDVLKQRVPRTLVELGKVTANVRAEFRKYAVNSGRKLVSEHALLPRRTKVGNKLLKLRQEFFWRWRAREADEVTTHLSDCGFKQRAYTTRLDEYCISHFKFSQHFHKLSGLAWDGDQQQEEYSHELCDLGF